MRSLSATPLVLLLALASMLSSHHLSGTGVDAQTTQVVESVNKFRTWVSDQQVLQFRADNGTAAPIPDWATKIDNPRLSKHTAVVDHNNRLVVFGGESFNPLDPNRPVTTSTNNLYLYDFGKAQWYTEVPTTGIDPLQGHLPVARLDHTAWSWQTDLTKKYMYVSQGVSDKTHTDVWRYYNRTWAKLPWTLPARHGHCTVAMDDKWAYSFGGRDSSGAYRNTFLKINANGTQFDLSTGPEARALHSCVRIDRDGEGPEFYVLGGTDGDKPLTDIWRYSVLNDTWTRISKGASDTHRSYDNTLIAPIITEANIRGSCAANFPLINCIGQNFAGTRLTQTYNVVQNRWIRNFWTEPNPLPGLRGHKVIGHTIKGTFEMYVVGGVSGVPARFLSPVTLFKTRFHMIECRPGFVNADLDGKCYQCAPGYAANILTDPHTCALCGPGTFSGEGACRQCPLGTYSTTSGATNSSDCVGCPEGFFTVRTGSTAFSDCQSCPLGTYAAAGGCPPCPAGTKGAMAGGLAFDLGCIPCEFGKWSAPGQLSCLDCPPGTSGGAFIKRTEPYEMYIQSLQGVASGGSTPTNCPTTIVNTVNAGEWFYVGLSIRDVGQNGANPGQVVPYDPLRLHVFGDEPSNIGLTATFNSYNDSGLMFYNCNNNDVPSGCSAVSANQTTPPYTGMSDYQLSCNDAGTILQTIVLRLRFDDTHDWVRLTFEGEGIRPAVHHLRVIGGATGTPIMGPNEAFYAGGIANTKFMVKAYDAKGEFDPTAAWTFVLTTTCSGGTASVASFRVAGGPVRTSHTAQPFVNGVWQLPITFATNALGCKFVTRHVQGTTITTVSPHDSFDSGVADHMHVALGSPNVTNFGVMHLHVTIQNISNDRVWGDNISLVSARVWDQRPFYHAHTFIDAKNSPTGLARTATMGVATLKLLIWTNLTFPWSVPVKIVVSYISPLSPVLLEVETEKFWISTTNATVLRMIEDTHKFPTQIRANSSFFMEIEAISQLDKTVDSGIHGRPVIPIIIELGPTCAPTLRLRMNTTTVYTYATRRIETNLLLGRTTVKLFLQGNDGRGCKIHVYEKTPSPFKELQGFWTNDLDIVSPHHLRHDLIDCNPRADGDCTLCKLEVGSITKVNVSVLSTDGTFLDSDQTTVVRFLSGGTLNSSIEVNGNYEQRVENGMAQFEIQILEAPGVDLHWAFDAGTWVFETKFNITYFALPTFSALVESLGIFRTYHPLSYLNGDWTCPIVLQVNASEVSLSPRFRIPTWSPTQEPLTIQIEAVNLFGLRDTLWEHPFQVEIKHCNTGRRNDFSWIITNAQGTQQTYSAAAAPMLVGNFIAGEAVFKVTPDFVHDTGYNDGMKGCSIVVSSNDGALPVAKVLANLVVEGFEIRKLRLNCLQCEPGFWSAGGNGRDVTGAVNHPGGCVPCMIGTFSADSGSTLESQCEVCAIGQGYQDGFYTDNRGYEGVTSCAYGCLYGSTGLAGGGGCPAGNIQQVATTSGVALIYGYYGTIGRRCSVGGCTGQPSCGNGQWMLRCDTYTTEAICTRVENKDLCSWNGATCDGPTFQCVNCPAGYYKNWGSTGGLDQCRECGPGGWSAEEGHSSIVWNIYTVLSEYYCGGETDYANRGTDRVQCTGTGTGQCANGTYSLTRAAIDSTVCLPCPKGYVCHDLQMYRVTNPGTCPNTMLNPRCTRYTNGHEVEAVGYNCPLPLYNLRGNFQPIPCPDGTYNNYTGRHDVSQCLTCPAGYSCPPGAIEPTYIDTLNTQKDTLGISTPSHVSFDSHSDALSCANPLSVAQSDFEGYVHDGHFHEFTRKWRRWSNTEHVMSGYKQWWWGAYVPDPTDRSGDVTSGSMRMENITGATVWQAVWLNHETTLDMVARVWIYNNLTYANMTKMEGTRPFHTTRETPFAGIELEVYGTPHWSNSSVKKYFKSVDVESTTKPWNMNPAWHLIEIPISPGFPVKYATFNITTKGFWQGYALYDDASLRPSAARVCNCSSGFYHNESEPTGRKCVRCPPGFGCSGGHLVRCANSWSVSVSTGCHHCWDGWLCDADGRGRLIPCEPYTKLDKDTETCSPCRMGYSCRDGVEYICNNGKYGDGGLDCIVCEPGYYAPDSGVPEIQCQRCPPGTTSNPGRNGCVSCIAEHFSYDGKQCAQCPAGQFILQGGNAGCRPCTNHFLDNINVTVYRNSPGKAVRVVPPSCTCDFDFKVERVEHLRNVLGEVQINDVTPSVLYLAGNVLGVHKFRVWLTSEFQATEQYTDVGVQVLNRAPVIQDDVIWTTHPPVDLTYNLTFVLFNDYDLDADNVFFTTATFTGATYGASNLAISPNRRTLTVDLPAGFLGPIPIQYGIMDKWYATVAECIAPTCQFAATTGTVTLGSRQAPPTAKNDVYTVPNGKVKSLDVLLNDFDPENDEIRIISTSTAVPFGTRPAILTSCNQATTCGTSACYGIGSTGCTCSTNTDRNKCFPSNGREYFIDYTALATACGWDQFTYTIETNDGTSTATVDVRVTNCYCASHTPGVDIVFLLDSTASKNDFGWQLAFVEAVQKRSTGGDFNYGAYDVGRNIEMQPLANTYIDPTAFKGSEENNLLTYDLGAGLLAAYNMKIASGVAARPTAFIVLSGRRAEDSSLGTAINAINTLPTAKMIRHYTIGDLSQITFDDLATDFVFNGYNFESLVNDEGLAAEAAMDDICAFRP